MAGRKPLPMATLLASLIGHSAPEPSSDGVEGRGWLGSVATRVARSVGRYYNLVAENADNELQLRRIQVAKELQRHDSSYEEWARASLELDFLCGYDKWKMTPVSDEYDYQFIANRVAEMRAVRESGDYLKLLFMLRTTLTRNPGNIGNTKLYLHSNIGTKYLIDDYIGECEESLKSVLNRPIPTGAPNGAEDMTCVDDHSKLDELLRTRRAFGGTALLLSGGGTMGMLHSGVVAALLECGLLPKIISGSSAGGIIAAILCTRNDADLPMLLQNFEYFNLDVFEETNNEESVWVHIARLFKHGAWTDISYLATSMREVLGEVTFQEAYNRTRRVLNIPVSSASVYEPPRLLNYLTAPNVYVWSAVCASCSVPLVFSSHTLLAKDPRTSEPVPWNPSSQRWIDGSVDNDLPMTRLNEMFNVNHFIVSQVNPHVVPFLKTSVITPDFSGTSNYELSSYESSRRLATGSVADVFSKSAKVTDKFMQLAVSEAMHRLSMASELGVLPNLCTKLRSVLAQRYSGDVTILPEVYVSELHKIITNPTPAFLMDTKTRGRRATWPKISVIRNHCAIELALDAAIMELRSRTIVNAMIVGTRKLSHPYSYFRQHQQSVARLNIRSSDRSSAEFKDSDDKQRPQVTLVTPEQEREVESESETESESDTEINRDMDEFEDEDESYMIGLFPEESDFDIASPVNTLRSGVPSATASPSHSRRQSVQSPTMSRHERRASGGSYNYLNYITPRDKSLSQPSTPGPVRSRPPPMRSATATSSVVHTHAQSLQSSPHARMRTYSDVRGVQAFSYSMMLPPSLDADSHVAPRRTSLSGRSYWPLHYDTASATIVVPGIASEPDLLHEPSCTTRSLGSLPAERQDKHVVHVL